MGKTVHDPALKKQLSQQRRARKQARDIKAIQQKPSRHARASRASRT